MRENVKYWIWLSEALGAGAGTDEITAAYPDPEKLYRADDRDRLLSGVFTRRQRERLKETSLENAENALSACKRNGWDATTPADPTYPAGLARLPDRPLVLYSDGDVSCLEEKVVIGVVGTRRPCRESEEIAFEITSDFARAGAVVVSGGALGIDSAAHEGALAAGGKTVCVMGCGLGSKYLAANEDLRRRIKKSGALISEYPPFAAASRTTFPVRNRIISGVSHGVLVVEAGEKSGSLITANRALEQGRDVFAIPGSAFTSAYSGANKLIRDGARAAVEAMDVLAPYAAIYPDRLDISALENKPRRAAEKRREAEKTVFRKEPEIPLDPDSAKVYALFESGGVLNVDDICVQSGLPSPRAIAALTDLETSDLIARLSGGNYKNIGRQI